MIAETLNGILTFEQNTESQLILGFGFPNSFSIYGQEGVEKIISCLTDGGNLSNAWLNVSFQLRIGGVFISAVNKFNQRTNIELSDEQAIECVYYLKGLIYGNS